MLRYEPEPEQSEFLLLSHEVVAARSKKKQKKKTEKRNLLKLNQCWFYTRMLQTDGVSRTGRRLVADAPEFACCMCNSTFPPIHPHVSHQMWEKMWREMTRKEQDKVSVRAPWRRLTTALFASESIWLSSCVVNTLLDLFCVTSCRALIGRSSLSRPSLADGLNQAAGDLVSRCVWAPLIASCFQRITG